MDEEAARARARNAVWLGAGDYAIDPPWLFVHADGEPDLYRNLATGLICRHFGVDRVSGLLDTWDQDFRQQRLDELAWIALESAAYQASRADRPALDDLRADFIRSRDARLSSSDRALVESLQCEPGATFEQVEKRVLEAARKRYRFDGRIVRAPDTKLHLGVSLLGLLTGGVGSGLADPERLSIVGDDSGLDTDSDAQDAGAVAASKVARAGNAIGRTIRLHRMRARRDDRAYVEGLFGKQTLSPATVAAIEEKACTGIHAGCHIWVADGSREPGGVQGRENALLREQALAQFDLNREELARNRRMVDSAIERLGRTLGDRIFSQRTLLEHRRRSGNLFAADAWRCALFENGRPFMRRVRFESPLVCVDLVLDASGSRGEVQSRIALQAYAIARGLRACGVPVRVSAFCSIRDYTVLRVFNDFGDVSGTDGVLRYFAAGMNRDGLALRTLGFLPKAPGSLRRVAVLLTDAAPMDVHEGFFAGKGNRRGQSKDGNRGRADYVGKTAIQDTARAVRELAQQGVRVVGIFDGDDERMGDAKKIFGDSFIRIHDISRMAEAAAMLIGSAIEDET